MENENKDDVVRVNLQELADSKNNEETIHKVDLSKPPQQIETNEPPAEDILDEIETDDKGDSNPGSGGPSGEGGTDSASDNNDAATGDVVEDPIIEEIIDDKASGEDQGNPGSSEPDDKDNEEDDLDEEDDDPKSEINLPENIQKLVDFMNETGGTLEDYVMLNKDISSLNEEQLLAEYHKNVEPDLDNEEVAFLMEDLYSYDEEIDDIREIKKKQIAKKRALSKAKTHLEGLKDKYYSEIKAGSKLTPEQQKAVDFFNRYNKDQDESVKTRTKQQEVFTQKTKKLFSDEFKGFEFKVGEKRYRYNVKDVKGTMEAQANLENFTKKYLGDDKTLKDAQGYHKALFTAMNADAIADHFYKQGMADAVKNAAKNAKNINMNPRQTHGGKAAPASGLKVRAVGSDNSPGKLRIKSVT